MHTLRFAILLLVPALCLNYDAHAQSYNLGTLIDTGGTIVHDGMTYSGFDGEALGFGTRGPSDASEVTVNTIPGGLRFEANFFADNSASMLFLLSYTVTPLSGSIEQIGMAYNGGTSGSGISTLSADYHDNAIDMTDLYGHNFSSPPGSILFSTSPEPTLYVETDINVGAPPGSFGGITFVEQTYLPVPEPASLTPFGLALLLLGRRRRSSDHD